ncbi:hypothetical protein KAJ83_07760 [Marivibrio halodurans]|uniref:Uncharacterized protein n=1 Tax=Marivibrio halodurans TaxID=2039722 RepID=A0A8J7S524_9PROT|nr:hypothetical protein [Marivibrio halodurans]MBP5856899.1 hypothetical protein [Marivibrio halodurans]
MNTILSDTQPMPPLERMRRLYDFWRGLPDDRPRSAVDLNALDAEIRTHVGIGKYLGECADLRYDVIGPVLHRLAPRLVPGSLSSDVLKIRRTDFDMAHNLLCAVGRAGKPRVYRIYYRTVESIQVRCFSMMLPLGTSGDGGPATDLLFGIWEIETPGRSVIDRFDDLTDMFLARCREHA